MLFVKRKNITDITPVALMERGDFFAKKGLLLFLHLTNTHIMRIIILTKSKLRLLMKRRILIKLLEEKGWYLKRHGGDHDIYTNGIESEPIPRHPDIKERLANKIIKKYKLR